MKFNYLKNNIDLLKNITNNLQKSVITFLVDDCEDLRCDKSKDDNKNGGTSLNKNQIPYNMEKDIDRLSFANAVKRFLESGKKEDAFDIYFCYLEMFIGDYEKTRRTIELLSEFETNGAGLLMKHRDHYSHSAYVFCLGLAIYESNNIYKETYKKYYKIEEDKKAAHHFLEYWGLTSLFHDIGYPFELPFEQVCSYFEVENDKRENRPFISYNALKPLIENNEKTKNRLKEIYNDDNTPLFETSNELFAYVLTKKLSKIYDFTYEEMLSVLYKKPVEPNKFSHFMDHAYFSSAVLFDRLFDNMEIELKEEYIDALTAILMHNSLYKFSITDIKEKKKKNIPFDVSFYPLAYLLMLCDELQCWDRTAYGRNSKKELHPMDSRFEFTSNTIKVTYIYDEKESDKINEFVDRYKKWKENGKDENNRPKLRAYAEMYKEDIKDVSTFQKDIEKIVDLTNIKLEVNIDIDKKNYEKNKMFLSDSNFINLYNFAIVLNGRWQAFDEWKILNTNKEKYDFVTKKENYDKFSEAFKKMSLEYKLSNINQAKAFAEYMNDIGCFFTNKSVDFEMVEKFTDVESLIIGKKEHYRWLQEKYEMGWNYGNPKDKDERENTRLHPDMVENFDYSKERLTKDIAEKNYYRLSKEEQDKDVEPMVCMLAMLKMFDGIRIYRYK